MVSPPGKIKVAQLLTELNIKFLTLKSFLEKNLRGEKAMISLNTRLDETVAGLCRQAFYRDISTKKKSQQVKLRQPETKTQESEPKDQETAFNKKDLERYRSIIKKSKKKRAAKKAKGKSKTNNPKGYTQIVAGGLCNPR